METNRDPQTDDMQRVKALGTHSSKWDVSIKIIPLEIRPPCGREGKKSVTSRGDREQEGNSAF